MPTARFSVRPIRFWATRQLAWPPGTACPASSAVKPVKMRESIGFSRGTLSAGSNYDLVFTGADFLISAAPLASPGTAITLTPPADFVYNGSGKSFAGSATGVAGFSFVYEGINGTAYGPSSMPPAAPGLYRVTGTATGNYSGSKSTTFSIGRKPVTIGVSRWPTARLTAPAAPT